MENDHDATRGTESALAAAPADAPSLRLWIHGWLKTPCELEPTVELDWTRHFDFRERVIPDDALWESSLHPALRQARRQLAEAGAAQPQLIDVRGKLSLTALLAVGRCFSVGAGYHLRVEQPTGGEVFLWGSRAKPSALRFQIDTQTLASDAHDVIVAFCITGAGDHEIAMLAAQHPGRFRAIVSAKPTTGAGLSAIRSNEDLVALVDHAREILDAQKGTLRGKGRLHLVLYAPASFALFLGQRLNAMGDIVTYERALSDGYQTSLTLTTG